MIFEISAVALENEPAEIKYLKFIDSLSMYGGDWKIDKNVFPKLDFGEDSTAIIELKNLPQKGVKFTLFFKYRNLLDDHHSSDDRVYIEFGSKKNDYAGLVNKTFEYYITGFNAYFAQISPESLLYEDFEISRNKNYRKFIPRFYPIMFISNVMCNEVFHVTLDKFADVVSKHVEKVWKLNDGIAYIYSSLPPTVEECNEFNIKIKNEMKKVQVG